MPSTNSRSIAVSIRRSPSEIRAFVADPRNLPLWAAGLAKSVKRNEAGWVVETPGGPAVVRFIEDNPHGLIDHYVSFPDGTVVFAPMRILANGPSCEVVFTLLRRPGMSDAQLDEDMHLVAADLKSLKQLLEAGR